MNGIPHPAEQPAEIDVEFVSCPLCGAESATAYLTGRDLRYGVPGEFQLVRCNRCRHVYMNPRPTAECIPRCYPDRYVPHQPAAARTSPPETPSSAERGRPWYLSPWARKIPGLRRMYYWLADQKAELLPPVETSPRSALEVGCAAGGFLLRLQQQGWDAQGVELAEQPVRAARELGLNVHHGTLHSAAYPDGAFDAVFAWMVIEHLPDPKATVGEIRRVLKPGGWFAFSVPNFGCWEPHVFGRYWDAFDFPRHLLHFTPRTVKRLLHDTGFECVRIVHQRNLLNVVGSLGLWRLEKRPRSKLARRWIEFPDDPGLWPQLMLAPAAKLLAVLRQGGRLTVLARRRE